MATQNIDLLNVIRDIARFLDRPLDNILKTKPSEINQKLDLVAGIERVTEAILKDMQEIQEFLNNNGIPSTNEGGTPFRPMERLNLFKNKIKKGGNNGKEKK